MEHIKSPWICICWQISYQITSWGPALLKPVVKDFEGKKYLRIFLNPSVVTSL